MAQIIRPFGPDQHRFDNKVVQVARNGIIQEVEVPWWVTTPEIEEKKKELLASQFYLVRQGSVGEYFRCKQCNGKHDYFTLMCVERPFDGLANGLLAYFYHTGKHGGQNLLTEIELQRYEAIRSSIVNGQLRDFADMHPQTARQLDAQDNDYILGGMALGILVPITKQKATALAFNINAKGIKPKFVLKGLENAAI